jgi:hypothetical protein
MKMNVFLPIDRKRIVDPLAATVPSCFHAYALRSYAASAIPMDCTNILHLNVLFI